MRQFADYCQQHESWLLEAIEALVAIESPTDDKAAVDRCGVELATRLRALGGRVERLSTSTAGDHLRAEFGSGHRQVLLLGHFDTVWPVGQLAQMPLTRDGDQLKGPGIFDMKAGIALGMLATRALFAIAPPSDARVVMLWTTDEETGSRTSRALLEAEARNSEAVLVLEPALPGGVLKTRRKGCGEYEIVVQGKAAHAGVDPGSGVSAIRELARQILFVETLQDLTRGVSVNVGLISGGTRPNVVAPEARAVVDVRASSKADADRVDTLLRTLTPHIRGARVVVTGGFERPPMERTDGVARLYALAQQVGSELGQTIQEGATGGGSDGNFCAALGVPTLDGLGALGNGAHALSEHVLVPALVPRAALLAALLSRLTLSSH
ncbi:MAG TPA: M20 family metallopeptidase [Vicinamibacterales bacterium]|nr:M20 family metallopeptidase [Vicinamibacterales bacterium]